MEIKKSLYAQYKEERENSIIIEDEYGFCSAVDLGNALYIDEIFVSKEYRKDGKAASYADKIVDMARNKEYKMIYGSVDPLANNSTISMKVLLAYGFKLLRIENNLIYLELQIGV
jgi:predicted GNAT family acetyltransferase